MPLSYIGQKLEEERKKKGLPSLEETKTIASGKSLPDAPSFAMPKTAQSTISTTKKTPQISISMPKQEQPSRLSEVEKIRQFEGQTLTQGTTDPVAEGRKGGDFGKIPVVGELLFGRSDGKQLYNKGSLQQQLVDQGFIGFFQEGFLKKSNPTRAEIGERIDSRTQKFIKEGYDSGEALNLAVQDVINETPGTAQNIKDLKNPNIELTDKEKEILYWINLGEDVFAVLDAPIFVGSTKVAREGIEPFAKEIAETVESSRDIILKRLKEESKIEGQQVDVLAGEDDRVKSYIDYLEENTDVSLSDLQQGVEYLQQQGKNTQDITTPLNEQIAKIKREPAKYIQDPVTGKMQGSKAAPVEPLDTTQLELSTKVVNQLEGKTAVSKQFIIDLANQPDIKDAEKLALREVLNDYKDGKIPVKEFAEKVQARLLPLETTDLKSSQFGSGPRYENINLTDTLRGDVANYNENIYTSPIKNSAGQVHFNGQGVDNYFAHTRIEDMADDTTRRVIEVQSDLFQKGRFDTDLAREIKGQELRPNVEKFKTRTEELTQLTPYRNTWWERVVREEVKKAAQDGKSVLQFPTGETAMKIEGIGSGDIFTYRNEAGRTAGNLTPDMLEVGKQVRQGMGDDWIITEVLDDGKFKAVPKGQAEQAKRYIAGTRYFDEKDNAIAHAKEKGIDPKTIREDLTTSALNEIFDISGKVDTNNPIYKFYEKDVQKFLAKNYDAEVVTDAQGVSWVQMNVNPNLAGQPVQAFAGLPAGYEEDEEGNITVDPTKAFLGMAAAGFLGKRYFKKDNTLSRTLDNTRPVAQQTSDIPKIGQSQYPLTSSKFSDSLSTEYQKTVGKSIDDTVSNLTPGKIDPKELTNYKAFTKGIGETWTKVVENVQDDMIRVRNLVENDAVKVTDDTDPYLAEILFHGRVGTRLENARNTVIKIDSDIVNTAKKNGVPDRDLSVLVNKYLHARHTPERNAALGDGASGLSNADAARIRESIEALPYSEDVVRIADEIQNLNSQTLDVLLEGQLINKELYDTLRNKYKNHIPLQRILDDQQDIVDVIAGKGFDVRSSGIKRAKGSDKDVADILANVVTNFEQAIIRAEKNRVDLTTLQFTRDNKHLGLFEEIKPRVIGKTFGKQGKTGDLVDDTLPTDIRESLNTRVFDALGEAETQVLTEMELAEAGTRVMTDGEVRGVESTFPKWIPEHLRSKNLLDKVRGHYNAGTVPRSNATNEIELLDVVNDRISSKVPNDVLDEIALNKYAAQSDIKATLVEKMKAAKGEFITERIFDPTVLELMENGKKVYLKINDESLAMALKGVNRQKVEGWLLKSIQAFTRTYSGLQTRFNPEFAFPNKIRDLQEAVVYAGSRSELGFKGGVSMSLRRDAYTGVMDFVRGKDSEAARLYEQMMEDGGTTGGIAFSTREAVELDIAEIRKLNRSNPRAAADKLVSAVDNFNRIFEDSTRLAVYREALDRGASRKRAAMLAKEASVNFNKFGKGGPLINALWMFSNAGIQGTTKFLRAMKNPKVAAITATSVGGAVAATGEWNDMIDPEWRDKIPEWDRTNGLSVVLPPTDDGEFRYFVLPVAWGIKPMKVSMDALYDLSQGIQTTPKDVTAKILSSIVEAYNPLGGTDTMSMATPTVLDIPLEITRNQAWHGGMIRPEWDERKDHLKYFSSLKDTSSGETAVIVTNGLSKVGIEVSPANLYYAYQGYIGGAGRTVNDAVNTMTSVGRGEMPDDEDIPIWGRFVKTRDNETLGAEADFFKEINERQQEADSERAQLNFDAEDAYLRLKEMPKEEAAREFERISASDEDLAKKIADKKKEDELGLTYVERQLKNLGVQNGDRAEMIVKRFDELETKEEKKALWDEYSEKGIITDSVAEQLIELLNQ